MKTFVSTLLLTICLSFLMPSVYAQQGEIDRERMNRDIRIMVSALEELFRVDNSSNYSVELPGFRLGSRTGSGSINGTYLPGYGVVFSIPDVTGRTVGVFSTSTSNSNMNSEQQKFAFSVDSNGNGNTISEGGINARIHEFLINYAPSISQLNSEDRILVVYGTLPVERHIISFQSGRFEIGNNVSSTDEPDETRLPVISMSVQKSDLDELRNGSINEATFLSRIDTVTKNRGDENRYLDLEVFANVLETGLKENENELFRLNRKPSHLYLDNFGIMYRVDFSRSPAIIWGDLNRNIDFQITNGDTFDISESLQFNLDEFHIDLDSLQFRFQSDYLSEENREKIRQHMEEAREQIEKARLEVEERLPELREKQEEARRKIETERVRLREQFEEANDPEKVLESLDKRVELIKELMVDYGRTLSTLEDSQSLLITINAGRVRTSELPSQINLRITKSDLLQMERGLISREQAIERIVETRN